MVHFILNQFQEISLPHFRKKFNMHGKNKKVQKFIWGVYDKKR